MMEYKGYIGQDEFDDEASVFHGRVINTQDVISFEGESVAELKKEFRKSIDVYLDFCRERGEEPDKPFSANSSLACRPSCIAARVKRPAGPVRV